MARYPAGCGFSSANVTKEVRIGYREWLLPFSASPEAGVAFARTTADPRPHLAAEDVLRIGQERPLDQDRSAPVSQTGIALARGFPGQSGERLEVYGTNLERLPSLCSVVRGSDRVRTNKDARPALKEGDTVVFALQLDGRTVLAGSVSADGFTVDAAIDRPTGTALPCYRVVPGKGPRSSAPVAPDLGGIISDIKGEADAEFGGAGIDGALLPGQLMPTRGAKHVKTSEDLRPYLSPFSVLRVGQTYPHVVSPKPGVTQGSLDVLATWRPDSGSYPGYLTRYRPLPGLASATRGKRCLRVTSDVRAILQAGDLIMFDRTARLVVGFERPPKGAAGEVLTGSGPTVTKDTVCLSHPFPGDSAEDRAWYFHDGRRLLNPATMRLQVTRGSSDAVPVGPDGKPGPDPRPLLRANDELKLLCGEQGIVDGAFPEPRTLWATSRRVLVGAEESAPVTRHGVSLAAPFGETAWSSPALLQTATSTAGAKQSCLIIREGRRILPGGVAVTHGTPVYEPKQDLREVLGAGDVIQAGIFRETAVAGGTAQAAALTGVTGDVRLPVSEGAIQMLLPHSGRTEAGLPLALLDYRKLPCNVSVTTGSKEVVTLCDMTDVLLGTPVLRIGPYRRLLAGDSTLLSPSRVGLAEPFPGPTRKDVPAYAATFGLPDAAAGTEDIAYGKLPGCGHVIHGSAYVSTTSDVTSYVAIGDALQVGTRRLLVVAAPPSPRSLRLTVPWPGPSAQCVPLSRMYRRLELPGRLACTNDSPDCRSSEDMRQGIAVGEVLVVVSRTGAGSGGTRVSEATGTPLAPNEREFTVVTPFTDEAVTLSEAYTGATEDGMPAYRVLFGSGAGVLMPGHVTVTKGLPYVKTSEDLSGSIRAGERLRVGLREFTAAEPITPSGFTLSEKYPGTSADGLKVFNLGRTERQASLEALAALKLRCRSIYCLAKIEQLERGTPSDLARSLTAGRAPRAVLASLASDQSAVPYVPTPEEYARGAFTADAATKSILSADEEDRMDVEREWKQWFKTAASEARQDDAAAEVASAASPDMLGGNAEGMPPPHLFDEDGGLTEADAAAGAEAGVRRSHPA